MVLNKEMDKETLRKKALGYRDGLIAVERKQKSAEILRKLEALPEFDEAKHVLLYYPKGSEVETMHLLDRMKDKKLYLPKLIDDRNFVPLLYEGNDRLQDGPYGIPEPLSEQQAPKLDLILVPGVAFDRQGVRLGMGKGFYDRFLSGQKGVLRIGLAFREQILDQLPKEPYDEPVDLIITDQDLIDLRKS